MHAGTLAWVLKQEKYTSLCPLAWPLGAVLVEIRRGDCQIGCELLFVAVSTPISSVYCSLQAVQETAWVYAAYRLHW